MSVLISTAEPAISNGIMAVGTAAGVMLIITGLCIGAWSILTRLISH